MTVDVCTTRGVNWTAARPTEAGLGQPNWPSFARPTGVAEDTWLVAKTRWPLLAASIATRTVSRSRSSPMRMTSGRERLAMNANFNHRCLNLSTRSLGRQLARSSKTDFDHLATSTTCADHSQLFCPESCVEFDAPIAESGAAYPNLFECLGSRDARRF